jgi:hypothetical protein
MFNRRFTISTISGSRRCPYASPSRSNSFGVASSETTVGTTFMISVASSAATCV